jgi:hypothetical protein
MFRRSALPQGYGCNRFVKMVDELLPLTDKTPLLPGFIFPEEEDFSEPAALS